MLGRKLEFAPRACWLAHMDEVAVGYVFAHPWSDAGAPPLHAPLVLPAAADRGFVHDLAVLPAARGLGVAATLFACVRAWSSAAGHRGMRLVALADAVRDDVIRQSWRADISDPEPVTAVIAAPSGNVPSTERSGKSNIE